MAVTIFTMTHKKFKEPSDPIYLPLQVGRACSEDLGYAGDDTGDNISGKNCYYGELTGVYWVWKNVRTPDYVGICHYRRYFCTEDGRIFNENDYLSILQDYDIITSKMLRLNFSYFDGYASDYNIFDLITTGEVIREKFPEYYDNFEKFVHGNGTYFANMMVTDKKTYDEYCEWLFSIFDEVEKRIKPEEYDDYHKRVFGFVSEFLLMVWVKTKALKVYECKIGMTTEKYETKQMKDELAEFFVKKDIAGAKEYFLKVLEKRPDVLMEASDITGELKTAMQVIAVCELEQQAYGCSIIDRICRFDELVKFFNRLNDIINKCKCAYTREAGECPDKAECFSTGFKEKNEYLSDEDICFLKNEQVSAIALEASARLFCTEKEELEKVTKYLQQWI